MEIVVFILKMVNVFLLIFFGLSGMYFFVFSFASFFYVDKNSDNIQNNKVRVAIFIPAYKEDGVVVETVRSAVSHVSHKSGISVFLLADQLRQSTINMLEGFNVHVICVEFENSSKSKSIKYALNTIESSFDFAIVLDADNIMAQGFVDHLLTPLLAGAKLVQGRRVSKNENSDFAVLDALSEEVNNSIFRSGHRALGFSASLIGSGFGADYSFFKELMQYATSIGGFDKELELLTIRSGNKIEYCKSAIVYDEKIQRSVDFVNQRRRWLSAQFVYLLKKVPVIGATKKWFSMDMIDKRIQFMVPPRVLSIGLSFLLMDIFFLLDLTGLRVSSELKMWSFVFGINLLAVIIAVPKRFYQKDKLKSLFSLPYSFLLIIKALLKVRNANKRFIHTTHGIKDSHHG